MSKTALILEGGGMRGAYTTGVLDFFLEKGIVFDACYAVSAGAGHACSFLSGQKGRAIRVNVNYLNNWRYCSVRSLLTTGCYFGTDFIYKTIPEQLDLFDYKTFAEKKTKFYACVTNMETAQAEYLPVNDLRTDYMKVAASSSLPFISKIAEIDGGKYLDGGFADSIPVKKAMDDGYDKFVVVLTQPYGYKKKEVSFPGIFKQFYKKYPKFVATAINRPDMYNKTTQAVNEWEQEGKIFVIRPQTSLNIGRLEKNGEKLLHLHTVGYNDMKAKEEQLTKYLQS